METMTRRARRWAARTSAKWPACSAPMVGTNAIRSPALFHCRTTRRSAGMVRITCKTKLLLHGADGEARNKTIDEQIVDDCDRQAGDQAGSHHRAPEIHVAADQKSRHPDAHGIAPRG